MEENTLNPEKNPTDNKGAGSHDDTCKTNCCSKLSFYFSILSLLGVIVLFILYFFVNKGESDINNEVSKIQKKTVSIGFVNSDTIMENYILVKNMKDSLEAKQTAAEASFTAQQTAFENSVLDYQTKMKANTLSIDEATKKETLLTQQQEYLYQLNEELSTKLAEEEVKLNAMLQDSIMNFLKRYNEKYHFDYILGFAPGSGILYANDSLDITNDVLEGLNKDYKSEK
ncbi:MAG: OmpH family outer membrane protein [Bacteroidota bacterium]